MQSARGFTLIELLIVITIIAILAALGLTAYQAVYKSGRDSKRQSDLKTLQSALQQFHGDQHFYPQLGNNNGQLRFDAPLKNPTGTKTYLNLVPQDSLTPAYCYQALRSSQTCDSVPGSGDCDNSSTNYDVRCSSYCLYARLENPPSGSTARSCGGNGTYNLLVTPP